MDSPALAHQTETVCAVQAAARNQVPLDLLWAIRMKESGRTGQANRNRNGSFDFGPMQVNSSWLPQLSKYGYTLASLKDSTCANIDVGAWILRNHYVQFGDWRKAIAAYHAGGAYAKNPKAVLRGTRYATDVVRLWWQVANFRTKTPA